MRFKWLDRWKGILIILVVYGHVVGSAYHLSSGGGTQLAMKFLYKCIYAFHMPAFFFAAGVSWNNWNGTFGKFVTKKIKRLFVPYLIFGSISIIILTLASIISPNFFKLGTTAAYVDKTSLHWQFWVPWIALLHAGGWPNGEGFQFNSVLWFLPCMLSLTLISYVFDCMQRPKAWLTVFGVLSVPLYCLLEELGLINLPFGIDRMISYFPYFVTGRLIGRAMCFWLEKLGRLKCGLIAILVVFVYVSVCMMLPDLWFSRISSIWALIFFCCALIGVFASLCVAVCFDFHWLELCGAMSLGIMLLHKFFVVVLQFSVAHLTNFFASGVLAVFLTTIMISACAILLSISGVKVIRYVAPCFIGE